MLQAPDYLTHFPDGGVWLDRICEDLRDGKLLYVIRLCVVSDSMCVCVCVCACRCIGEAIAKTFKVFDNALHYRYVQSIGIRSMR